MDLIFRRDSPPLLVQDGLAGALRLSRLDSLCMGVVVVLWQSPDAGDVVGEASDNVEPWLVVVNTHSNEEGFIALLSHEAKDTRGTATAHGEGKGSIRLRPCTTVGIVPNTLLDDLEECVGVALVDMDSDGVRHAKTMCQ